MTALSSAFFRAIAPPPDLTVSAWADQYRMLSPEASAEPGLWDTDRAPFQRAIMDAILDPEIETVVVMSSSQVGKTEILLNMIGYNIDVDPCPMLVVQPTLEMAEAFSKDRLDTMLRDSPTLHGKVTDKARDTSNTMRHKTFPGGHITLAGSNSPASLASRPIRALFADEVDRWDVSHEGDPLSLAEKRTTTFWNRKKVITSTPTIKGLSRIEAKYLESDQRECFVACPHCATRHKLEWRHVKWEADDPETAHLVCPECGSEISEAERQEMLRDPEWRASQEFHGIAGFFVWEAYSPWRRMADIVADFLKAKRSPDTLQVFINTSLGETWEEAGDEADTSTLVSRREPYVAPVPADVCCLTMGVDVQDDRLEALIIGWGLGEESWVIESHVVPGDPQRTEPWEGLDEILSAGYRHESGALLNIYATCVDTAGHRTQFAYDYVAKHQHQRVYAVIGRAGSDKPIVSAPAQKRSGRDIRKVALFTVGADTCKGLIHSRLKATEKGPGYIHFPLPHQHGDEFLAGVDEEFLAQINAEKLVTKFKSGVPVRTWVQTRPRNEALDMFVYAIAALRLSKANLEDMAARLHPERPVPPKPEASAPRKTWIPRSTRGSWLRRGR